MLIVCLINVCALCTKLYGKLFSCLENTETIEGIAVKPVGTFHSGRTQLKLRQFVSQDVLALIKPLQELFY